MRSWVIVLAACGGTAKQPAPAQPAPEPKRDLAVAEPVPKEPEPPEQPIDPNDPSQASAWLKRTPEARRPGSRVIRSVIVRGGNTLDVAPSDLWSPCVKEFVQRQGEEARRAWTAALSRYVPSCDADQRVVMEPPHEYAGKPYVAMRGRIGVELIVELASCSATSAERVVIAYDGSKWTAPLHDSEQRGGCTIVRLPDTRTMRRVLRNAIDASHASVQLDGDETAITEDMKRDLRLVLDALSAP